MRMLVVAAGLLALPLGFGPLAGARAQDGARCGANVACREDYPLRMSTAAGLGTPLMWAPRQAALAQPPIGRPPILFGRTIPIDEIIGRRIRPIGRVAEPTMFNKPVAELGPNDSSLMLMPIGLPPRKRAPHRAY